MVQANIRSNTDMMALEMITGNGFLMMKIESSVMLMISKTIMMMGMSSRAVIVTGLPRVGSLQDL